MEDWAYAASWDTREKAKATCKPKTYHPFNFNEFYTNTSHIKPAIYLIEANNAKHPKEMKLGDKSDIF